MADIDAHRQMLSAPSDAYSAGAWCEAANDLLAALDRLAEENAAKDREIEQLKRALVDAHVELGRSAELRTGLINPEPLDAVAEAGLRALAREEGSGDG